MVRAGGRSTELSNDWTGAQVIIKTATEITVQTHCNYVAQLSPVQRTHRGREMRNYDGNKV